MPSTDYSKLAAIYDLVVTADYDIPFFLEEVANANGPVAELMAGTGRVSLPVAETGIELTCVDSSEEMLSELRKKAEAENLAVKTVCQNVTELELPEQYDLIYIPLNSFLELSARQQQVQALSAIYDSLIDGGRFICTLHNPAVKLQKLTDNNVLCERYETKIHGGHGQIMITVEAKFDEHTGIVKGMQTFSVLSKTGEGMEELKLPLCYALLGAEEFRELAEARGFVVEAVFGDYERAEFEFRESPFMVWKLRRPRGGSQTAR